METGANANRSFIPRVQRTLSRIFEPSTPPSPPSGQAPPPTPDRSDVEESSHTPTDCDEPEIVDTTRLDIASGSNLNSDQRQRGKKSRKGISKRKRLVPLSRRIRPSLVLENSGSVARDHLASERTFLAYVRTSLAIASTGVGDAAVFPSQTAKRLQLFARPLGATTIMFGILVLSMGAARYFSVQNALTKGVFPVSRVGIMGITLSLATIVIIVFAILVSDGS
ncbi:hypothetical protein BD779DRAFT_1458407 [Infundibulicybe gibba]|nr:hypothetical protein BD779DRAFT_1458407 [Infundibulicybe gibba]